MSIARTAESSLHRPSAAELARSAAWVLSFTALTALAGQIRIPVPFSPVPLTLQLVPVLLAGALLGPSRGAASQFALLAAGAFGLPVFAGGAAGPAHLLGATGGYLIGFVGAAWLVGRLVHGPVELGPAGVTVSMLAGAALIHVFGVLHLALYLGGSLSWATQLGSLPFLLADLTKAILAVSLFIAWRWSRRRSV